MVTKKLTKHRTIAKKCPKEIKNLNVYTLKILKLIMMEKNEIWN